MKSIYATILLLLTACLSVSAQVKTVSDKDLKPLIGTWKGKLTYLDYTSGKPYTMPADLNISQGENHSVFFFSNLYPDEPKANSIDTITISKDRRKLNNENIISAHKLKNGNMEIVTEYAGTDGNDNKAAVIRHTYTFSRSKYINVKEVKFTGESLWIKRHEYAYTR